VPRTRSRRVPTGTYRLQLRPEFGFDDAAAVLPYLHDLGVSHVYLSPVLQAAPGSTHGYDVVDHAHLNEELGGAAGFHRLSEAARELGLGIVVDVVPNHMAVPTPVSLNAALWSVLRHGPASPYARWFDVEWAAQERTVLMPVLGRRIGEVVADGELTVDPGGGPSGETVLRYFDHVFPVRPGTEELPLAELLDRQFYRLAHWRVGDEELNYRRFFDIDTLAGVRVEDEQVFAETHAVLLALVAEGRVDGLRIDHPDGLADPREYVRRLARATDGAWVVVEKILEGDEELPADWPCAGTTGYDALLRVGGVLVDHAAAEDLTSLYTGLTGEPAEFPVVVEEAKRFVITHGLQAEIERLVEVAATICHEHLELRDHTRRGLRQALVELLVATPVYRVYVVPDEPAPEPARAVLAAAADVARSRLAEDRHGTLDLLVALALGEAGTGRHRDEFVVRFQQTCGPVMAKGVEDTAFYRWLRLTALNEVGGDPAHLGVGVDELHAWCARRLATWPDAMTTLSTHDTKRSEDVRARLAVLSELPHEWGRAVTGWRTATAGLRPAELDANTEYLLWQTLVGAWPIDADRLTGYLEKATREAKRRTTWTEPDPAYDEAVAGFARAVLDDGAAVEEVASFVDRLAPAWRADVLAQKLLALTVPGVPDVYQGCELTDLSLVDPDNRRPVDYDDRRARLARLDAGAGPADLDDEKLLVVSRTLRLRRDRPGVFGAGSGYRPLAASTDRVVAFERHNSTAADSVVTVAARLSFGLAAAAEATVQLPSGSWTDVLSGGTYVGAARVGDLLASMPVALLVRSGTAGPTAA
jgi:(1->4)-alpha-D-glucan 1-alpha-D-glucosylmutase